MKRKKLLDGTSAVGLEKPISANESMYVATVQGDSPYVKSVVSIARSNPFGRNHELFLCIVAPPSSEHTTATSIGHLPTPFRHARRTVRGKRKSCYLTFYLGTASSGFSTTPLPVTNFGNKHRSSQLGRRKFSQVQSRATA
ncbi:hypothetical protein AVEN_237736-1 [Araneus ventricosus]|uniref:Uncharacterized protein n=1 Tax=Araneus ventricosus TaxID=182803 RepID=A0A4Y2T9M7_ARAVE|nr:hypothetical protein AVEN_237736-1 [Araneus ventricosus]